jgi:hypothetical protein
MHTNEFDAGFILGQVWLCDNCSNKKEIIGDSWDDHIELQPICAKCASTWEGQKGDGPKIIDF